MERRKQQTFGSSLKIGRWGPRECSNCPHLASLWSLEVDVVAFRRTPSLSKKSVMGNAWLWWMGTIRGMEYRAIDGQKLSTMRDDNVFVLPFYARRAWRSRGHVDVLGVASKSSVPIAWIARERWCLRRRRQDTN
ncbi:hypothetical protein Ae201684P_003822 [Aphanomyces euteiches]|uniref:Uncharacterized protein n=1 Tax=Aphanomyces euteiches TaxID=100861 RepID=A0A6G0XUA0_9STRA|nr:hypothetical protein Ae201684_001640 [Aphanomyces euteiches]KAH9075137.1 hypothetical protein Ae201684P_003822 [Aphanomyces euteiches]